MTDATKSFFGNPAFREYIFLLIELERLFRRGLGQSPQADAIRDAMDFPSHRYTAEEDAAISRFGDHLNEMSAKYGPMLDCDVSAPPTADNGIALPAFPPPPATSTEFSK